VGGESTRPGAEPVPLDEEIRRVVPIVEMLAQRLPSVPISVDTSKAEVARQCLEEGASVINDVSALRADPKMAAVVREHGVPVVLMHMRGNPRTMQQDPAYTDAVSDIRDFFRERLEHAAREGIKTDRTLLDPGIGFGKTLEHNLEILRNLRTFKELGRPLVIGTSRKSFIARLLAEAASLPGPADREEGTVASCLWAAREGAHILRVHDVKGVKRALTVWQAIERGEKGC
jgi:dihydropteroate synthase